MKQSWPRHISQQGCRHREWFGTRVGLGLGLVGLLVGCGSSNSTDKESRVDAITFWTPEIQPSRLAVQQDLAEKFAQTHGVTVVVEPVEEEALAGKILASAETSTLPDVIFLPLDLVATLSARGLLDAAAATQVINQLGVNDFAQGPLSLVEQPAFLTATAAVETNSTANDATQTSSALLYNAVPADGWGQLLLFRSDLFEAALLTTPGDWDSIQQAVQTLNTPPTLRAIELPTNATLYTQQVFEHLALSNGCRLITPQGEVDLTTRPCLETFEFYRSLVQSNASSNLISLEETRRHFLAGQTAMVVWSPFILDELAGLWEQVPVTADLDPPLYQRTGVVASLLGPRGKPVQWGEVNYFAILANAPQAAQDWVTFLMTDENYLAWLSMAPEGKFPLRLGLVDDWSNLTIGVDRKARLTDIYPEEVLDLLINGVEEIDRWGFPEGKGQCVGSLYRTQALTQGLSDYLKGEWATTEAAAQAITDAVKQLEGCGHDGS